jgi:hypothetical protein
LPCRGTEIELERWGTAAPCTEVDFAELLIDRRRTEVSTASAGGRGRWRTSEVGFLDFVVSGCGESEQRRVRSTFGERRGCAG